LCGAARLTKRQILLNWRLRRAIHALTPSSVPTAEVIIRQTLIYTHSRGTTSTMTSITKNNKNFMKAVVNQLAWL